MRTIAASTQPERPELQSAGNKRFGPARLITAAAAYAAVELAVTLFGGFFTWGRAEALLFLAFRPWLLLLAAFLVAGYRLQDRAVFYALSLVLAAACQASLLLGLGAFDPWPQILRGVAAGAALLIAVELLFDVARRLSSRWGRQVVTALLAVLFLSPLALRGYDLILLGPLEERSASRRPDLMLMTALPIIWGEKGAFDPTSRPAAAYKAIEREFRVRPLDVLDPKILRTGRLLLLAQPRALDPEELVALDDWVRGGGNALILTDPGLAWPSELPLGDPRRPPAIGLLGPILTHWGVAIDLPRTRAMAVENRRHGQKIRRLVMASPGRIAASSPVCRVEREAYLARCSIGAGKVVLLADADLLHDALWVAPGRSGALRHQRRADNPLVLADLLDGLGGSVRPRVDGDAEWRSPQASATKGVLLSILPLLVALAAAGLARRRQLD